MRTRNVSIDQDSVTLRIIADPPSLWPVVGVGVLVGGGLLGLGAAIANMILQTPPNHRDNVAYGFLLVWIVLFMGVIYVLLQSVRRQRAIRGVVVDRGDITVHVPDDGIALHHFPLADLKAAELQRRVTSSNGTNLVLVRRSGGSVVALRQMSAERLIPAVDALNGMLQEDRHFGFEVILKDEPVAGIRSL